MKLDTRSIFEGWVMSRQSKGQLSIKLVVKMKTLNNFGLPHRILSDGVLLRT